jgi:hypothetical protein
MNVRYKELENLQHDSFHRKTAMGLCVAELLRLTVMCTVLLLFNTLLLLYLVLSFIYYLSSPFSDIMYDIWRRIFGEFNVHTINLLGFL